MIVLFYDSSAGFPNYTQPGPGPKLHNSQHQDSSWGQFSAEMIMKQTKVIMSSICLFSPHTGKKKGSYCTSTSPAVSLCIEYVWTQMQTLGASTEVILSKAASTSPEKWHRGWCVENESIYGSILMANISPQWGEGRKKKMLIILCCCSNIRSVTRRGKRWSLIVGVC